MMKSFSFLLLVAAFVASCQGFVAPRAVLSPTAKQSVQQTPLFGFLGDKERDALTRDSEPEQFFQT